MTSEKRVLIISFLLAIAAFLAFWQVTGSDFITYDDTEYVTANSHVRDGLTLGGIAWAFTTGQASNWHPLTWISHMGDVELFGMRPGWHHLVNLLFHIANTLLLFLVLHRMTKALWQSAFVAALFALHPLHVESVAWVAERKDVLSTFFWFLTMGAYVRYLESPLLKRYLALLFSFALGLAAKPMLVTLPFVLLLLDYWPLGRLAQPETSPEEGRALSQSGPPAYSATRPWSLIGSLLAEKAPLFLLAALSSIVTYLVQQKGGAVQSIEVFPMGARLENALVSYVAYMAKMIWPANLALFYPHPDSISLWKVFGSATALFVLTVSAIRLRRRSPYATVGWFWYLGTLVPVIGIVQVGTQAMADRYTYIPLLGLFMIVAWAVPELLKRWRFRKQALVASSAVVLSGLFAATWVQVGYWRDSITLYTHSLDVTDRNSMIYNNRGATYDSLGKYAEAIADLTKAVEIDPKYAEAYANRGLAYEDLGNYVQAIADCDKAIEIDPKYAEAYANRGVVYKALGKYARAIDDFSKAIEIDPADVAAYSSRGTAYGSLGDYARAVADFSKAIEIDPQYADAYANRGTAYASLGNPAEAIVDFNKALEINPQYALAYANRGAIYGSLGDYGRALSDFTRALQINPKLAEAYGGRAVAYGTLGKYALAIDDLTKAIEIDSRYTEAYVNRALAYGRIGNRAQSIEDLKTAARLGDEGARNLLRSQKIDW